MALQLTLRIYQQVLKRRCREVPGACNELLGTSPVATSSGPSRPQFGPQLGSRPHGTSQSRRRFRTTLRICRPLVESRRGNSNPRPPPYFPSASIRCAVATKTANCRDFLEPTRGLEPRTPSLPWRGGHYPCGPPIPLAKRRCPGHDGSTRSANPARYPANPAGLGPNDASWGRISALARSAPGDRRGGLAVHEHHAAVTRSTAWPSRSSTLRGRERTRSR